MTKKKELSLELIDLSSVWFAWSGGKVDASVRCFLCRSRRGAFGTKSQEYSSYLFQHVLPVPLFGFFSPPSHRSVSKRCAWDCPKQCLLLWSLLPDDLELDGFCSRNNLLRVVSITRCPQQCDVTRYLCASRHKLNKNLISPRQIAELGVSHVLKRILRVVSKSCRLFSPLVRIARSATLLAGLCRGVLAIAGLCEASSLPLFCSTAMIDDSFSRRT